MDNSPTNQLADRPARQQSKSPTTNSPTDQLADNTDNVSKCNAMPYTSKINLDTSYCIKKRDSRHTIQKVDSIKDLGILFDTRLNFKDHIQEKINKVYNMIGLLKRNFVHVDGYTFILLYKTLVRPHLEYANSVCK